MITYEISFRGNNLSDEEKQSFLNDAGTLIGLLRKNGQVVGQNNAFIFEQESIRINVLCPDNASLDPRHNNRYINASIAMLEETYNLRYSCEQTGNYPAELTGRFADAGAFLLYWGGFSPIRSLDDFEPVPLYEFPYTYTDGNSYHDLYAWESDYEAIYRIWVRGEMEERRFYDYLSSIKSPLSQRGLAICRRLELLTGKDCYFYLFNYTGARHAKKCPVCNNDWKLTEKLFDEFDLKCDTCKIISNTRAQQ
jgi:predicted  nucleic acid-binding Zn ribbon protein